MENTGELLCARLHVLTVRLNTGSKEKKEGDPDFVVILRRDREDLSAEIPTEKRRSLEGGS